MFSLHRKLLLPLILSGFACGGEPTRPGAEPTACASTSDDQTFDCARLDARFVYASGQPVGVAFIRFNRSSDSDLYRVTAPLPDSTGHTVFEFRRRRIESVDTATVALLVVTPPASGLGGDGAFYCTVSAVRLRFRALGAVPDTVPSTGRSPRWLRGATSAPRRRHQ
jgi:hypothetical protein